MRNLLRSKYLTQVGVGFLLVLSILPLQAEHFDDEAVASDDSDVVHASPQQRRGRGGAPERGVYKARITPHWLTNSAKFWYRNDLRDSKREFILVDAERGKRERAFDHKAVAKQIGATDGEHLPVDELQFSDDGQIVTLINATNKWRLDLKSGKLAADQAGASKPAGLKAEIQPRPSLRNGPDTQITFDNQRDQPVSVFWIDDQGNRTSYGEIAAQSRKEQHTFGGHVWLVADARGETLAVFEATDDPEVAVIRSERVLPPVREEANNDDDDRPARRSPRSPDGKWVASIKEFNVFVRPTEGGEEIQLSQDGASAQSYALIQWSPDSQSLVAWRVESGERKEVHLLESSPAGGGR